MISFLQLCKDEGLTTLFHDDRMVDQIIDSLSTLKHLLGMNVVASHHCVPSWWRDPLQPWSLPPSSPCISPADWLEGQEAQVMWSDGPISPHCTAISPQWSSIKRHQICRLLQKERTLYYFSPFVCFLFFNLLLASFLYFKTFLISLFNFNSLCIIWKQAEGAR